MGAGPASRGAGLKSASPINRDVPRLSAFILRQGMARGRQSQAGHPPMAPAVGKEFVSVAFVIIVTGGKKKSIHRFISEEFPPLTDF